MYDDDGRNGAMVEIRWGWEYLIRFLCAELDVGSVDVAITDPTHGGFDDLFVTGCFGDGRFDTR